eukprot:g1557.t1
MVFGGAPQESWERVCSKCGHESMFDPHAPNARIDHETQLVWITCPSCNHADDYCISSPEIDDNYPF